MTHDLELLSIGRIRRILAKLEPHQRLIVLQYVSQAECNAQEAVKAQQMAHVAEVLDRAGPVQRQGNGSDRLAFGHD